MPAKAKMADTQKGMKSTERRSMIAAKILPKKLNDIFLYYIEASLEASPV